MFENVIENELRIAWEKRRDDLNFEQISAFRLINREEWRLPLAVDIYLLTTNSGEKKATVILYCYAERAYKKLDFDFIEEQIRICVDEFLLIKKVKCEIELKIKDRFKKVQEFKATLGEASGKYEGFTEEAGAKFWINTEDYLDTGLFLDHRTSRLNIRELATNKRVLNLFAYTGAFSVQAAFGGASQTFSVDLSKKYCEWARDNLELNNFSSDKNWVIKMDTFEFFNYAKRKQLVFDLIIIDPPTFSKNKGSNFSVQRDHLKLLNLAAELLAPEGKILFSNNCLSFLLDREINKYFEVENIQSISVSPDFHRERFDQDLIDPTYLPQNQIHNAFLLTLI